MGSFNERTGIQSLISIITLFFLDPKVEVWGMPAGSGSPYGLQNDPMAQSVMTLGMVLKTRGAGNPCRNGSWVITPRISSPPIPCGSSSSNVHWMLKACDLGDI
jgi:hypothetical protein